MNLPREKAIIFTAGVHLFDTNDVMEMIIKIDNFLIRQNQPPMTPDERNFLDGIYDECWLLMKSRGLNRKNIRGMMKQ